MCTISVEQLLYMELWRLTEDFFWNSRLSILVPVCLCLPDCLLLCLSVSSKTLACFVNRSYQLVFLLSSTRLQEKK